MSLDDLENQLVSSRRVRDFLKHFSETQWARVIKAATILGIQELEKKTAINNLSVQDIEDTVGKSRPDFVFNSKFPRNKLVFYLNSEKRRIDRITSQQYCE